MRNFICLVIAGFLSFGLVAQEETLGGFQQQSPTNPDIQKMANKAVALMQKKYPDCSLITIHKAATQIVAGTNYYLMLEVETWEQYLWLDVYLYRDLEGNVTLDKVQETKQKNILGGYENQSLTNPEVKKTIKYAVAEIQKKYPKYKFVKAHKAATQIVAGTNYILILEFETKKHSVMMKVFLHKTLQGAMSITREHQKKQKHILGGYEQVSPEDLDVKEISAEAISLIQEEHPDYMFVSVHKAGKQIVAGTNYCLVMEFRKSDSQKVVVLKVVLYKTLDGNVSLTGIESVE